MADATPSILQAVAKHMEWQRRHQAPQATGKLMETPGTASDGETHGVAEAIPGTTNEGETHGIEEATADTANGEHMEWECRFQTPQTVDVSPPFVVPGVASAILSVPHC